MSGGFTCLFDFHNVGTTRYHLICSLARGEIVGQYDVTTAMISLNKFRRQGFTAPQQVIGAKSEEEHATRWCCWTRWYLCRVPKREGAFHTGSKRWHDHYHQRYCVNWWLDGRSSKRKMTNLSAYNRRYCYYHVWSHGLLLTLYF